MIDKLLAIFYYLVITLVVMLGLLLIGVQSNFIEGYELRIVQSGSMEPAIPTGSLIVTRTEAQYTVGDVITFSASGPRSLPTTHRITADGIQNGEVVYTTKGDANSNPDLNPVALSDVDGRVVVSVPWLGYIIDFARQPLGFILLIVVPALVIVFDEVALIVKEFRRRRTPSVKKHHD